MALREGSEKGNAARLHLAKAFAAGVGQVRILFVCGVVMRHPALFHFLQLAVIDFIEFGAGVDKSGKVLKIVEKPQQPESNLAVIGIYMYDSQVFDFIRPLKVSARGELEITDVNNKYIEQGTMTAETLQGWWTDAGTFESLYRATQLVVEGGANKLSK